MSNNLKTNIMGEVNTNVEDSDKVGFRTADSFGNAKDYRAGDNYANAKLPDRNKEAVAAKEPALIKLLDIVDAKIEGINLTLSDFASSLLHLGLTNEGSYELMSSYVNENSDGNLVPMSKGSILSRTSEVMERLNKMESRVININGALKDLVG